VPRTAAGLGTRSVDATLAEGHAASVNEGSSAYGPRRGGWPYGFAYDGDPAARPNPQIRVRPYTGSESVLILLDAMLTVFDGLPAIQREALRVLRTGWDGRVPVPDSVTIADGDSGGDGFELADETEQQLQQRRRVVIALTALRGEVIA
jgi:CheY-like chemotaxis protein